MDAPYPSLTHKRALSRMALLAVVAVLAPRAGTASAIATAIFAFAFALATSACTAPLHTPPQIGDCVSDGSAACTVTPPSGGIVLPVDGGSTDGGGEIISQSVDGGSCGTVDTLVAANCSVCMTQNCCMSDFFCSADDGCKSLFLCAATAVTGCSAVSPGSQTDFDDLMQCIDLNCPSQCLTVASRDI